MRKVVILLTVLAFFGCLFFGIYLSNISNLPGIANPVVPTTTQKPVPFVPALQHNLLFIQVNDLQAVEPELHSVWGIFVTMQNPTGLMFVQLYPSTNPSVDQNLQSAFSLSENRTLPAQFNRVVQEQLNLAYEHIILVDDEGMQVTADWLRQHTSEQAVEEWASEQEVWERLCQYLGPKQPTVIPEFAWEDLVPQHAYTDLPFQTAVVIWSQFMNPGVSLDCEVFDPPSG